MEEGFPESEVERLHTPVGLSIHAETPEEIAVSIVAELIMVKNSIKKTGGYDKELLACLTGESYPEQKKALATIVARQGSAPREIGTKMAVLQTEESLVRSEADVWKAASGISVFIC